MDIAGVKWNVLQVDSVDLVVKKFSQNVRQFKEFINKITEY